MDLYIVCARPPPLPKLRDRMSTTLLPLFYAATVREGLTPEPVLIRKSAPPDRPTSHSLSQYHFPRAANQLSDCTEGSAGQARGPLSTTIRIRGLPL